MEDSEISFDERIHASAVQFLIQENEKDAAIALLACTFELSIWNYDGDRTEYNVLLRDPRWVYEIINSENNLVPHLIEDALTAVMPWDCSVKRVLIKANMVEVEPGWKDHMLDIALEKVVHNQGIEIKNQAMIIWQNLRFRSESEKRIAEALDRASVLFLPNCLARLTTQEGRKKEERT